MLRCYAPADAPLLTAAISESLDHLRAWMPWALHEPESVADKAQRLRRFRADFDGDRDYIYGIFTPDERRLLGGTGLHPRVGPGALEIGYWIHAGEVGRGYATEAAAALTRIAFELHGVSRMEIRCDPRNGASEAVPRKLGYVHEATLRRRQAGVGGEPGDAMIWTLFREDLSRSPAATAAITAYDCLGSRLPSPPA